MSFGRGTEEFKSRLAKDAIWQWQPRMADMQKIVWNTTALAARLLRRAADGLYLNSSIPLPCIVAFRA